MDIIRSDLRLFGTGWTCLGWASPPCLLCAWLRASEGPSPSPYTLAALLPAVDAVSAHITLQHSTCRVKRTVDLGGVGPLCWLSLLIILRNMPSIASFLHPGGSPATQGKGELERCLKGRNVVIREVKIELSRRNLVLTVPVCAQTVNRTSVKCLGPEGLSKQTKQSKEQNKTNKQNMKSIRQEFC